MLHSLLDALYWIGDRIRGYRTRRAEHRRIGERLARSVYCGGWLR